MRNKTTRLYKIQWNDHSKDEAMWEHEEFLQSNYPSFFHRGNQPSPVRFYAFTSILGRDFL
jgi:hypothetical protein